jgi:hypothetical protein
MSDPDDDYLDGMCDLDFEVTVPTTDDLTPWVVLFADLLGPDQQPTVSREAIEARAAEWVDLFAQAGDR